MPNTPYMPGAYNYWQGNRFVIPPLGQYARPVYADVLAPLASNDPALAAAMPQAVDPRIADHAMMRDGGFQGGMPSSAPGVGMNAQAKNAGEFFGSIGRGLSTISNPVGLAMGVLSANKPASWSDMIPGKGLYDAVQAARDYFGGMPGDSTLGSPQNPGPGNPSTPGMGDGDNPFDRGGSTYDGGSKYDGGSYGSGVQAEAEKGGYEGSGMYAHGGMVNKLMGPNPPGPDDGFAGLDRGEFVVRAKEARKHRGLLEQINKGKLNKKKARGLLD